LQDRIGLEIFFAVHNEEKLINNTNKRRTVKSTFSHIIR